MRKAKSGGDNTVQLNKNLFTLGEVGDVYEIADLIKKDACGWLYFVYRTKNSAKPLHIGTLQSINAEECETVVIGIASSRALARKLALHIVIKALALDGKLEEGLNKLFCA